MDSNYKSLSAEEKLGRYVQQGVWIELNKDLCRRYESNGYKTIAASILFNGWGKGLVSYVSRDQAKFMAKTLLKEFDRRNGERNTGRKIDRIVFEHAGATGNNWHYHMNIYVPKSYNYDMLKEKYYNSMIDTVRKGNDGKHGWEWRHIWNRLNVAESQFEQAKDNCGVAYAIYATHENRKIDCSWSDELTVANIR